MAIELLHMDCMTYMAGLPDKAFDLAIVDPPYGIGMDRQIGKKKGEKGDKWDGSLWDGAIPTNEYFDNLKRISINQIIWGGNYFGLPPNKCFIIWDKVQRIDFADCEYAWTSFDTSAKIFTFARSNLQGFQNPNRFHPTEKPIKLYKWLLKNYATEGDKILDTHGGSFSHAIAAYDLGFNLTIMEIDKDYYEAGKARYEAHVAKYAPASEIPMTKKGELKLF